MGWFDTPRDNIRKRLPKSEHLLLFSAVETYADQNLGDFSRKQREYALGVILGLWVNGSVSSGLLNIRDFDGRYIHNLMENCARRISDAEFERVREVIDFLIGKEMMPGLRNC